MTQFERVEGMAARIRAAAREDGLVETAQVKLLGLDEVRLAAGQRWPRMREYVREGSLKIITERVGPDDAVIPCGDGYLVVFADAGAVEAQRRCAEIRDALIAFYLGEEALCALRADVRQQAVSAASLAGLVTDAEQTKPAPRRNLQVGDFWPVWSAHRFAVAAYLCAPTVHAGSVARMGYTCDFVESGVSAGDHLDLDLCLLEQACEMAETAGGAAIGVTIHATTLQVRKTRMIYARHLAGRDPLVTQRMFLSIAEVAPGTPLISLTEWVNVFRPSFSRVALDLHHSDRALTALRSTGAWAAGFTLPQMERSGSREGRAALDAIFDWSRTLGRQRMHTLIHGFADPGFLDLATCRGAGFATGSAIGAPSKTPAGPQIATLQRSGAYEEARA